MAENTIDAKVRLRYDDYNNWTTLNPILRVGEAAVAIFSPSMVSLKVGDGSRTFNSLPWIQGVAADVYAWAKVDSVTKVPGLSAYIESVVTPLIESSSSTTPTAVVRTYQIIQGENDNAYKYYLRYRDSGSNTWTVDYANYINVYNYERVYNWITENDLTRFSSLGDRTGQHITAILNEINYTNTEVDGQFVSAVSQTKGKILVKKRQVNFTNLVGSATVAQGGTGVTTFPEGEILIGNGTNALTTLSIDTTLTNNDHLAYNYAIKSYIDNKTAGLESAMHYVGDATVPIDVDNNPYIEDYNFAQARPGDVVNWAAKEYVWTGTHWRLFGDEGSYVIRGNIRDSDIHAEAAISMSKISGLTEALGTKVTRVEGKGLSTNDYTNEERTKLTNIEANAQVNLIEHVFYNGTEIIPTEINDQPKSVNIQVSVREFPLSAETKLDTIQKYAQVNTIEHIVLNHTTLFTPQTVEINNVAYNKTIDLIVKEFDDESRQKLLGIAAGAQVNKIENIMLNNTTLFVPQDIEVNGLIYRKTVNLLIKEFDDASRTKLNSIEASAEVNKIQHIFSNSVEKRPSNVEINGLVYDRSIEILEFDTASRTYLYNIEQGAQVNRIEHIYVNDQEVQIGNNKTVSITIPTYTEHINKIEKIFINDIEQHPNANKEVRFSMIVGAKTPNSTIAIDAETHQLIFAKIAQTGNINDLIQTQNDYIILYGGTSTAVMPS